MRNILLAIGLLTLLISCNSNDSHVKYSYSFNDEGEIKREMIAKNAQNDIEIKMEGTATFNAERSAITGLTTGGIINYRNKDTKLTVNQRKEGILLSIEKNSSKISATSDTGKEIIAEAIREIEKLQLKH